MDKPISHRDVWRLSWPVILANLTIPLVGTVDTAIMGRMPDAKHLGAVALGATAFTSIYWLFGFLRMSSTGLTAQALGANNINEVAAVTARALVVALALGLVLITSQIPLSVLAFDVIFPGSPDVEGLARDYFSIRIWAAPATLVYTVAMGVLFGLQRMRATLALGLALNLTNALLDFVFVVGFDWGVQGVAWGTLISEWGAALAALAIVFKALVNSGYSVQWPAQLWPAESARRLLNVSTNLIVRTFFVQAPFLFFTALGAAQGNVVLAANAILMQMFFIAIYAMDGFAHTVESLAGHAQGRADLARFRQAAKYTTLWAAVLALLGSLTFALLGTWLIDLFTHLEPVANQASRYLPWLMAAPIVSVWAFQLDGVYIGLTQTRRLRNAMLLAFGLFLATLIVAYPRWGNHGLWLALLVFMASRGLLLASGYPTLVKLFAVRQ